MDRQTSHTFTTRSENETRKLGCRVGRSVQQAMIIRLVGDLGSGKTCFVQGLARGLDVPPEYHITSPTYTLMHEYPGRLTLLHVDLYRIYDETDAETIGLWEAMGGESVVAVEWAERLSRSYWPDGPVLDVEFENLKDDSRRIKLFGYGLQISDLIKEVGTLA